MPTFDRIVQKFTAQVKQIVQNVISLKLQKSHLVQIKFRTKFSENSCTIAMQNLQICLSPKQITFSSQFPMNVRLMYKKICITNESVLQKIQNKVQYPIQNKVAIIKDEEAVFKLSKQFQLRSTKIVIAILGIPVRDKNPSKDKVSCLGDVTLDLLSLRQKKKKNIENELFQAKLAKCPGFNASMKFEIKFLQRQIYLNEMKKSRRQRQKIPELGTIDLNNSGILKTQCYYKQQIYISRRQKIDKPSAYQISRKNFVNFYQTKKNVQIKRKDSTSKSKEKMNSKDSLKENSNNGSYKKRFMYDVNRMDKSRSKDTSKSISSKQIGSSYLKVYQKDKSPSPRTRTPEPITLQTLKYRQTNNRTNHSKKMQPLNLNLSGYQHNRSNYKQSFDDSKQLIDPDTFRAHQVYPSNTRSQRTQSVNPQQPYFKAEDQAPYKSQDQLSHSNISSNSLSTITNEKDSKYKMITEKLEMIQSKIRKQKQKYGAEGHQNDSQDDQSGNGKSKSQEKDFHENKQFNPKENQNNADGTRQTRQTRTYTQRQYYTQQQHNNNSFNQNSRSPVESTCPRNQNQIPSPIQVAQTPQVYKFPGSQVKMSQFTINSRKNELQQQPSPKSESLARESPQKNYNSTKNTSSFDQIISPSVIKQTGANVQKQAQFDSNNRNKNTQPRQIYQQTSEVSVPLQAPSTQSMKQSTEPLKQLQFQQPITPSRSQQKRQSSPTSLSFQKRQSEIKLEKKSSQVGRNNYLQTQVKMFELQIQQKDMKFQKLQKKFLKKQDENNKLVKDNQEYLRKITLLTNQLIDIKKKILQIEGKNQRVNQIEEQLQTKILQLKNKETKIIELSQKIQTLQQENQKNTKFNSVMIPRVFQGEKQLSSQQSLHNNQATAKILDTQRNQLEKQIFFKDQAIENLQNHLQTYQQEIKSLRSNYENAHNQNQRLEKQNNLNISKIYVLENKLLKIAEQEKKLSAQQQEQFGVSGRKDSSKKLTLLTHITVVDVPPYLSSSKLSSSSTSNQALLAITGAPNTASTQQLIAKTMEKQSKLQQSLKNIQLDNKSLEFKLEKRSATIQKLSSVNDQLNIKLFQFQEKQKKKFAEMDEQIQQLSIKNAQLEQLINELNNELSAKDSLIYTKDNLITSKDKQAQILKQLLREKQDNSNSPINNPSKQLMRRQISSSKQSSSEQSLTPNTQPVISIISPLPVSKSSQLLKTKNCQSPNYYQHYLNQKTKSTNLQAQLRFSQNKIRSLNMQIDNLKLEKKDLEQEIDMIALNNDKQLAKKGSVHKVSMDTQVVTEAAKLENKVLKEQIKLLQMQVMELNGILDVAIQKTVEFDPIKTSCYNPSGNTIGQSQPESQTQRNIAAQKYIALVKRLQAYEQQLRSKKNKMAEIINSVWKGGNASLIDQIDKIMDVQE